MAHKVFSIQHPRNQHEARIKTMDKSPSTTIMHRLTIAKIVEDRNESLRLAREGLETIAKSAKVANHYGRVFPFSNSNLSRVNTSEKGVEWDMEAITRELDRGLWVYVGEVSGIMAMMDSTARDQWHKQLKEKPPELNFENIQATLISLNQDRDIIFRRGLVSAFRKLNRDYMTNKGFCIKKRIILGYSVDSDYRGGCRFNYNQTATINDLERCFLILDGKTTKEHGQQCTANTGSWKFGEKLVTNYMIFMPYQNGNVHITFTRPDLVDHVNRIIADEYGNTLAEAA
jgi:hypothetical protein